MSHGSYLPGNAAPHPCKRVGCSRCEARQDWARRGGPSSACSRPPGKHNSVHSGQGNQKNHFVFVFTPFFFFSASAPNPPGRVERAGGTLLHCWCSGGRQNPQPKLQKSREDHDGPSWNCPGGDSADSGRLTQAVGTGSASPGSCCSEINFDAHQKPKTKQQQTQNRPELAPAVATRHRPRFFPPQTWAR